MKPTRLFSRFFESEKAGGLVLVFCVLVSLLLSNVTDSVAYQHFWHLQIKGLPLELLINDGLMTVFFLMIGLEIKREMLEGELSNIRVALLPVLAAVGGMAVPALIHYSFNAGKATQNGFGIPMATDIAFTLGVLSLCGSRVPAGLKVFLTALAIIDDLGAILIIALFYGAGLHTVYLALAALVLAIMALLNRLRVQWLPVYLIPGCLMWFFMYRSGIHATLTGVLVAFVIPSANIGTPSLSHLLQRKLHRPVAFFILPLFALANTAISFPDHWVSELTTPNSLGIWIGLSAGKPAGIFLLSVTAIGTGIATLPAGVTNIQLLAAGLLAGIGFTMSVFIALLAFKEANLTDSSKIAVMAGSLLSGLLGLLLLRFSLLKKPV